MLFSVATGYALRTLAILPDTGRFRLCRDLADQLGLPGAYLAKVLQALSQGGILESLRGPRGGFRLARPAHQITVAEVVRILDGVEQVGCVMNFGACQGSGAPCPFHRAWTGVKAFLARTLDQVTVEDLQPFDLKCRPSQPQLRSWTPAHQPAVGE